MLSFGSMSTEPSDTPIAKLTVAADGRYIDAVADLLSTVAAIDGLEDETARKLGAIAAEICRNAVEQGYEGGRDQTLEVEVSRRAHSLVVAIQDRGIPFDYRDLAGNRDRRFSAMLAAGYAREVRFLNLGPGGNRVEIVRDLPALDIRDQADPAEHDAHVAAPEAPPDEPLGVRLMRPDEAVELARVVYRCYGYTYDCEFVYYPDQVAARLEAGLMRSCVAQNERGEIVGHLALSVERPAAAVAESGQAVVDPRYRGHGLFKRMKLFLIDDAGRRNCNGIYSEAVTAHPYSQKGNLSIGAHECGFLLGYSRGDVSFRAIGKPGSGARQSIAMMYLPVSHTPAGPIHVPAAYRAIVRDIIETCDVERVVSDGTSSQAPSAPHGRLRVVTRADHDQAFLTVESYGADTLDSIRYHLDQLCLHRLECIYVDLPLSHPETATLGMQLRDLGFFFGAVLPGLHGDDALRLQYLNNVEISTADIQVASDHGRRVLSAVTADRQTIAR